ncbi:MAG: RdgB/HAM1 family non-canonical purine NTP pyrophosphatase [Phycisphaerae bacterium]|nr:RdgB/HAM1 family non-canonical purine NTP pyrophosphatase [Phycisphaerae bacterium]
MPHVLLATRNAGKLREMREIAVHTPLVCHGLEEYPDVPEAEETGTTFAENARLKALYYADATGLPTLADDSGLEVDALDGAPGVHSARYGGVPHDYAANNRKLVRALANVPPQRRTARFHCAMAFVKDGQVVLESEGAVEGMIIDQPRGQNGFGYDPHFLLPELGLTAAELPPEQKNALSHRGQALRAMLGKMEALFRSLNEW